MKIIKLLVLPIVLILFACEKDLYDEHLHKQRVKSEITLEQFKSETGLNDFNPSIKIKLNVSNSLQRNADGSYELSDFDIDTSIINRIVVNEKVTYTFQLIPKEEVNDRIFNIVYYFKDGWHYTIFEIKPTPENLIELKEGLTKKIDGTLAKIYNSYPIETMNSCIDVTIWIEDCHGCSGTCDRCSECLYYVSVWVCLTPVYLHIDAGSSTGSSTGGSTGGGPSDSQNPPTNPPSNDENAIATSPVINTPSLVGSEEQEKTPCNELAKISSNAQEKAALQNLTTKTAEDSEYGYYITKNNVNGSHNTPVSAYSSSSTPNQIVMPIGGNNIGAFHTHPTDSDDWVPMFSDGDLNYLFMVATKHNNNEQPKEYSEYFLTLTVPEGTFAIKIKNVSKFFAFRNSNKWDNRDNSLKALRNKYNKRNATDDIKGFQKDLLNLFNEMDAGIGLYEADPSFNSWQELKIDSENPSGNPIKQPCN